MMLSLSCTVSKLASIVIALSILSPPPYGQPYLLQGLELEMGHEKLFEILQFDVLQFGVLQLEVFQFEVNQSEKAITAWAQLKQGCGACIKKNNFRK
ncbi:hypothetical protein Tco_1319780 [Tanacetum coccineum]